MQFRIELTAYKKPTDWNAKLVQQKSMLNETTNKH